MSLFVDSSAWFAAADRGDRDHARATAILSGADRLVTTDHVLVEAWLLMRHLLSRQIADQFWNGFRRGGAEIEVVTAADLEVAWAVGEAFPDQDFSIVDRTSFAVMQRLGIRRAASFDEDFAVFRFGPNRSRAFEVVR